MKFLIIGIGNIGLRHVQGLTKLLNNNLEFFLFDHDTLYKTRFNKEIKKIKENYTLNQISSLEDLKNIDFELTIIATTATNRSKILSYVLGLINTKFILIEKPICQSEYELQDLKKISNRNIFVNFPRRYCEWHKKIKNKILSRQFNKIIKVKISGGYIGLACNACHFIDLLNFWTNKHPSKIYTDELDEWYESKRSGFYEIEGKLKINYGDDLLLELNSYKYKKNLEIEVYDYENKMILYIDYHEGYAKFSDGEIIHGKLNFQSENTHNLLKLMQDKDKEICSLDNAINSYEILIKELIIHWNLKFKRSDRKIMIT